MEKDFAAVQRRLRELDEKIRSVEMAENMSAERTPGTIFLIERYSQEYEEIDYLLRFWTRQNNGYGLGRWQWALFSASVAIALTMLILYLVQVLR